MDADGDVLVFCDLEEFFCLVGSKSDRLGEAVDVVDQVFFDYSREDCVDDMVNVSIFCGEFRWESMGGEETLCDSDFEFAFYGFGYTEDF